MDRVLDTATRIVDMGGVLPPPSFSVLFLMLRPMLMGAPGTAALNGAAAERALNIVAAHCGQGPA